MSERITLDHGSGGSRSHELIRQVIGPALEHFGPSEWGDSAALPVEPVSGRLMLTTDSYTVEPLFFSGGDIGKLAVCGTCNDLAMMLARPSGLTLALIIEEGFGVADLQRILASVRAELEVNRVSVLAGDTKVLPSAGRSQPGLFINTTGAGICTAANEPGPAALEAGDRLVLSGPPGLHEAVIFCERERLPVQGSLVSDCRSLWPAVEALAEGAGPALKALRDVTRGGLATVLNEWTIEQQAASMAGRSTQALRLLVYDQAIPYDEALWGFCEITGINRLNMACEGTFLIAVKDGWQDRVVKLLQANGFEHAATVGEVIAGTPTDDKAARGEGRRGPFIFKDDSVPLLQLASGVRQPVVFPRGSSLPRIC